MIGKRLFFIYLFFIPFYPMHIVDPEGILGNLSPIFLSVVVISSIPYILNGSKRKSLRRGVFPFLVLFFILIISDSVNVIRNCNKIEISYFLGRLTLLIIFLMAYMHIERYKDLEVFFKIIFFNSVILSLVVIISIIIKTRAPDTITLGQTYAGIYIPFSRSTGIPMSYGKFGILVLSSLPLCLSMLFGRLDLIKGKQIILFALIIILFAVTIAQSRNIWLSTVISFVIYGILLIARINAKSFVKIGFIITTIIILVMVIYFSRNFILSFKGEGKRSENVISRIQANKIAWQMFRKNPFLGVGHTELSKGLEKHFGILVGVHNNFFSTLACNGILGFFSYLGLFILTIWKLIISFAYSIDERKKEMAMILFVSLASVISCLNFYEGFFVEMIPIEMVVANYLCEIRMKIG